MNIWNSLPPTLYLLNTDVVLVLKLVKQISSIEGCQNLMKISPKLGLKSFCPNFYGKIFSFHIITLPYHNITYITFKSITHEMKKRT
jgi:hypothetical protein